MVGKIKRAVTSEFPCFEERGDNIVDFAKTFINHNKRQDRDVSKSDVKSVRKVDVSYCGTLWLAPPYDYGYWNGPSKGRARRERW